MSEFSDISALINALEGAQKKEKYTTDLQKAAARIDIDALELAHAAAFEMGNSDTLLDESQAATLKAGFGFSLELGRNLNLVPHSVGRKDLYVHSHVAKGLSLENPWFNKTDGPEWMKARKKCDQNSQATYIQLVSDILDRTDTCQ
ncbi:hypothetical protein N7486_010019 [Penicillium sp. IBT 16267x]|nr:hypothetical protein N7486_010019 [Penicillium sp. IBT 16267x]